MKRIIVPITICCGRVYAKFATISIPSFLKHHSEELVVLVDPIARKVLSDLNLKNIKLIDIAKYEIMAKKAINIQQEFESKEANNEPNQQHMQYLALKPVIMHYAIIDYIPTADYILSIDVDSYFSGNIINKTHQFLDVYKDIFDIYLVSRKDPRMHVTCNGPAELGTGYHLWKRSSNFIKVFIKKFPRRFYTVIGNQGLINKLMGMTKSRVLKEPLLHFVSPDLRNKNITDEEIKKIKPAYIHLHGPSSFKRMQRFKKIFEGK